jgi:MFS family permease
VRSFSRLWAASTLSNLGDGVVIAAFPLLAASISTSPQAVAGMTAAATVPWLLFGLPAGVIVDRLDRIRLMWIVDLARAGAVAGLGVLVANGNSSLALLYAVVFVLGIAETLFDSAAMAVVPAVLEHDISAERETPSGSLESANGRLFAGQLTANQFVGPPLGALLFGVSAALPPLVDSITFVVSAFLLTGIRLPATPVAIERRSLPAELREGLAWVWQNRSIRALAIGAGVINLAHTGAMAVLVLFATANLGLSEIGFGALFVVSAVGALIGSLTASRVSERLGRRATVLLSVTAIAISLLAIGLWPTVAVTAVGLLAVGLASEFWNVVAVSYRQNATPDRLRGRVMSAYRFIAYGSFPLGALLGGWIASSFSIAAAFSFGGVLVAILTVFMVRNLGALD